MRDFESERQRLFSRRGVVLGGLQAAMFGALAARMYYLQVVESAKYVTLAEENRINLRLLAPARGLIVDRFGQKLASNAQNFRLMLVPEQTGDLKTTLDRLATLVKLTDADRRRIARDMAKNRKFMPVIVADQLTWAENAAIEVRLPELDGVSIEVGEIRHYPYREHTAHMVGYVGMPNEEELKADPDPLLGLPGVQIGKTGVEKVLETKLRGKAGSADMEVNAFGRVIREVDRRPGTPGPAVRLTIDIELQRYVQQRLMTERSATAVVMDVRTGAVYALASHPSFDPNAFSRQIDTATYQQLTRDETRPLINKVLSGVYSPGSTFKTATALAGLESGLIGAGHKVLCTGAMELGNHLFHCWKRGGHGTIDMVGAMRESCDVFFYDVARRIGIDRLAETARQLGFGAPTGLDLPGEKAGLMPDRAWKEKNRKESWLPGESLINGIGQGYVLATPLQLCVMAARVVNGGFAVVPHITKEIEGAQRERTVWPSLGFDPANIATIVGAMNSVCLDKRGTAYAARITVPGQEMGGKTGTAQVKRITMAERRDGIVKNENRPWTFRDHALFIGYAPVENPRYAISVVVDHGGGGSHVAAPIARDILKEAQRLDPTREQRPATRAAGFTPTNPNAAAPPPDEEADSGVE